MLVTFVGGVFVGQDNQFVQASLSHHRSCVFVGVVEVAGGGLGPRSTVSTLALRVAICSLREASWVVNVSDIALRYL